MRLQSFLADAGIASRRKSAEFVETGLVKVNGVVVKAPGHPVDPDKDKVEFKGKRVQKEALHYYLFYKPTNVITTAADEAGRKKVTDFFTKVAARVFPVGRLDRNSTGLLIMTNDGQLANGLMHPSRGVEKRYAVLTDGPLGPEQLLKFRKGLRIEGETTSSCQIIDHGPHARSGFAYEVVLHEGKNRQIRKMMEILGRHCKEIHRFEYGPLKLGRLKPGEFRPLSAEEVATLKECVGGPA
jgi:23S rRNA pseudouridine2605 synthase